jgi:hypothetical protein
MVLLAGILVGQVVLYGPSLLGRKILLPLDLLAVPRCYIPQTPGSTGGSPHNRQLLDLVSHYEPARHFLGTEIRAGRFPLWNPCQFAGAPDTLPKFSPFMVLGAVVATPKVLPWIELLKAMVGGLGFCLFCRRALGLAFWPATVAGWCYPVTAFFVLWEGYNTAASVLWLPWLLLAVDATTRRASRMAPVGLSVVTCLVLTCGQIDIAGQVLLVSGLYALWAILDAHRGQLLHSHARKAVFALVAGWGLGFLLAAPGILPVMEYTRTGARMARRGAGAEERAPVGLPALPQIVLPRLYGSTELGTVPIFPKKQGNLSESTAAAYVGVLATLFLAPLAWCSRRHRSVCSLLAVLAFLALSWSLNVPGLVSLWRLPGLNLMSFNRFVFVASFAILALAAIGLDVLCQGRPRWRWWFWLLILTLGGLCAWRIYRAVVLPEAIATGLEQMIRGGKPVEWVQDQADLQRVQVWFAKASLEAAALCGLGLAAWIFLRSRASWRTWFVPLLGILMLGDLLVFGHGRAAQCDPALYFPRIPVLAEIGKSVPGRIIGYNCLPANLATLCGLRDIRGYDGVDPARLVDIVSPAADPRSKAHDYARTQWMAPMLDIAASGEIRLPPVLDMLNVRYVIFRDPVEPNIPIPLRSPDYWILINSNALPRAYVPARVEVVSDSAARLEKLASSNFDPRQVAYVETSVDLPSSCRGTAEIVEEIPTHVKVAVNMQTPGLVVLADLWDKGWRAYMEGRPLPILRANHAVRGVVLPAGAATIEFRYEPASFTWGLRLAGLAVVLLIGWASAATWHGESFRTGHVSCVTR